MFAPPDELFRQVPCVSCQQDIIGLGIECSVCPNKLRLCAECFGLGAEISLSCGTTHKPEHEYHFFDSSGGVRIFPAASYSTWTAKEHVRLLDSIEQYGFGNWYDISKFVDTKTPQESKEEYVRRFVCGNLGKTWAEVSKSEKIQRPTDKTVSDFGPLSPSLTRKLPELEIGLEEVGQLGYMPKRDDYEKEYDNDAEKLVSQLVFNPEDEEAEIALKLALVDIYSRRLRERVRRKRVIRDYQLVAQFFKKDRPTTGKRFLAYEKEMWEKFKPFAQFHNSLEHHHFIQNLVKEKELRFRIQELFKYRRNGVTQIHEAAEYERFRARKSLKATLNPISDEKIGESNDDDDKKLPALGDETAAVMPKDAAEDDLFFVAKSPTPQLFSCEGINSNSVGSPSVLLTSLPHMENSKNREGLCQQKGEGRKDLEDRFIVNIENKPSVSLLIQPEIELCHNLSMEPCDYICFKTALLSTPQRECPVTVSLSDWSKIQKFLLDIGWI